MKRIGITGTIASGKTSVSILLKKHGFAVFNCDQYAKMATHAANPCFARLIEILGEQVKDASGDIDRAAMAECIFNDEQKRLAVNAVVHHMSKKVCVISLKQERKSRLSLRKCHCCLKQAWKMNLMKSAL